MGRADGGGGAAVGPERWPRLVAHADWGTAPGKRWMARAVWLGGRYWAGPPERVGEAGTLLARLRAEAGGGGVLVGFDFPIGVPAAYAERVGIREFAAVLPRLGHEEWARFYDVAERPEEVSLWRPFYPRRPGGTSQRQLVEALGVGTIDDLRRRCELRSERRKAAAPLFWTLGAQQVGRAAIGGWRDVLGPAARDPEAGVALWPFEGAFGALLGSGKTVVVETYPAEFYGHLGVAWRTATAGGRSGKRWRDDRAANGPVLAGWAEEAGVGLDPDLGRLLGEGFGPGEAGEDPFDAVVGLLGMLNVVLGRRPAGDPVEEASRRVEGWILGQTAAPEPVVGAVGSGAAPGR